MSFGKFRFNNLQEVVEIIKALKSINSSIDYTLDYDKEYEPISAIFYNLFYKNDGNFANVEYVLKDIKTKSEIMGLIEYLMFEVGQRELPDSKTTKLVLKYALKNVKTSNDPVFEFFERNDMTIPIYMQTRNITLLKFIAVNLTQFDLGYITKRFMDDIVKLIDRNTYLENFSHLGNRNQPLIDKMTKKYDDAVKRRVTDISAGFGYQGIPTAVLDEIVGQTVDTSGMTAYKVNKIIDKFNVWKTDTTMRIGENEDAFEPQFQDAEHSDEDDEIIEI